MTRSLTTAERLKFRLLARGVTITPACAAALGQVNGNRQLTPADYASTTGVILRLEDQVWVNAPIVDYNPNFVDSPPYTLDLSAHGLVVSGEGLSSSAQFWLPPLYHGECTPEGRRINDYVFTHGDRVRLAPIQGCGMTCKFCNIPYEDRYDLKPIDVMVDMVRRALQDALQPAHHLLISGGTPRPSDTSYLREVYRRVLAAFPDIDIDIMMVPVDGLIDVRELRDLGLHELSINLEIHDRSVARRLMPQKYRQGLDHYLRFLADAAELLGQGRVRSMLMVGLEPVDDTLAGVQAVLDCGCVPVLSPFRPDPATPLRSLAPLGSDELEETFLAADRLARSAGTPLGPSCPPCTHNTLTLGSPESGDEVTYRHPLPTMF